MSGYKNINKLIDFFFNEKYKNASITEWQDIVRLPEFEGYAKEFTEKYGQWNQVNGIEELPVEVVDKIFDHLYQFEIFKDPTIFKESFIDRYADRISDWANLFTYKKFSEKFLIKHRKKYNIKWALSNQKISESFFLNLLKEVSSDPNEEKEYWSYVSGNHEMPESFLIKCSDKLDWYYVSLRETLSESFIERYKGKLKWSQLSSQRKFTVRELYKFEQLIDWTNFSMGINVGESKVDKNGNEELNKILEVYGDRINWFVIASKKFLIPLNLLEKYSYKFNQDIWWMFSLTQEFDYNFIMRHIDKLNLGFIEKNERTLKNLNKEEKAEITDLINLGNMFVANDLNFERVQ